MMNKLKGKGDYYMKRSLMALLIMSVSFNAVAGNYYFRKPMHGDGSGKWSNNGNGKGPSKGDDEIPLYDGDDDLCHPVGDDYILRYTNLRSGSQEAFTYYYTTQENNVSSSSDISGDDGGGGGLVIGGGGLGGMSITTKEMVDNTLIHNKVSDGTFYTILARTGSAVFYTGELPGAVRNYELNLPSSGISITNELGTFKPQTYADGSFDYCGEDIRDIMITGGTNYYEDPDEENASFAGGSLGTPYIANNDSVRRCRIDYNGSFNADDEMLKITHQLSDNGSQEHDTEYTQFTYTDDSLLYEVTQIPLYSTLVSSFDNGVSNTVQSYYDQAYGGFVSDEDTFMTETHFDDYNYYARTYDENGDFLEEFVVEYGLASEYRTTTGNWKNYHYQADTSVDPVVSSDLGWSDRYRESGATTIEKYPYTIVVDCFDGNRAASS